jgi:hypothetical protein
MSIEPESAAMYCDNCGAGMAANAEVCAKCGFEMVDVGNAANGGTERSSLAAEVAYECIPGTRIALGDGETVWRSYAVTQFPTSRLFGKRFSTHRGGGNLYVTGARIMFFASYDRRGGRKRSIVLQETQVEHVTGITAFVSRRFSVWAALLVGLFGLFGLISLVKGSAGSGLFLLIIAGAGAFLLARGLGNSGTVGVRIHSGSTQASPLGFGELGEPAGRFWMLIQSLLGPFGHVLAAATGPQSASDLLVALPGPDAERVVTELGALIADLQSKGTLAGTHWGVVS